MNAWSWWVAVGRLEAVKRIVNYDYKGVRPTRTALWWQVCDVSLVVGGVRLHEHDYSALVDTNDSREPRAWW